MDIRGWLILGVIAGVLVGGLYLVIRNWIPIGLGFAAFGLMGWIFSIFRARRFRALAVARSEESICQFARSFDCRVIDPVLIRAVYETVQEQMGEPPVPLRALDRFLEDLSLDGDDLDEIAVYVAEVTGCSLASTEDNPFKDSVVTVQDLVGFLHHQSKLPTEKKPAG